MSDFEIAMDYVAQNEEGLVKNSNDPGGITNIGISLRFMLSLDVEQQKVYGFFPELGEQFIETLTYEKAKAIYCNEFWKQAPFADITNQIHCNYIFDMAINCGIAPAIKCAQRACWAIQKKWELLIADGILGQQTIEAIKMCGMFFLPVMRAERGNYYRQIVANDPSKKEFLNGWLNRTYNS